MKRRLRNLSKGKLAVALVLVCALVFGGYFGYHKLVVHADTTPTKQVVNTLDDYNKMCESGKVNCTQEAGDKDNPFLILEIVPYYGQAEIGYLISGCEPIDMTDVGTTVYSGAKDYAHTVATAVFADEYERDAKLYADGQYVQDTRWTQDDWKLNSNDKITAHGYYEKVSSGETGDFVIDHYEADTTGMFYTKDENGTEHEAYRPVFRKAKDGEQGDFIWRTVYYVPIGDGFSMSESQFNTYAMNENKYAATEDEAKQIVYKPGEREYTTREDTNFYSISVNNSGVPDGHSTSKTVEGLSVYEGRDTNINDFVRTSLNLEDKSETAIRKMKIAVKTIEPQELMKNPEWIDYADLVYLHEGYSVGMYNEFWKNSGLNKYRRVKDALDISRDKDEPGLKSSCADTKFSGKYDWGWTAAKKLFFKVNQLGEYDGSSSQGYGFAPLLCSKTFINGVGQKQGCTTADGTLVDKVNNKHLDYPVMEVNGSAFNDSASNTGLYKFALMNFMMDQENFYNFFFEQERESGGKVISESDGSCNPQEGKTQQQYWNVDTFLPLADENWGSQVSEKLIQLYKIQRVGGSSYMNYPDNEGLHGATFYYNGTSLLSQGYNNAHIGRTSETEAAFEWFEKEYGEKKDYLSPAEMVHYLLQYKRHAKEEEDVGTRDKQEMRVLEIEPCSEFTITETYLTAKYLPASTFKGKIKVDHMTTAEFNSSKKDVNGSYDLIYIGDNVGKFNYTETKTKDSNTGLDVVTRTTKYNNEKLDGYVYLHVGDSAGEYHSSGDDISKLKEAELYKYAQGGNALVLADTLAIPKIDGNGNIPSDYTKKYLKAVDSTSQMHKLLQDVKSGNAEAVNNGQTFKYSVCSLSDLSLTWLKKNCLKYKSSGGFAFPSRAKTGMSSKDYNAMKNLYKDYVGLYSKITSTPVRYVSDASLADNGEINPAKEANQSLAGSTLDFEFILGDQREKENEYAVRLYIDLNGDGVIADDELVEDTYKGNPSKTYSYQGEDAKDASGKVYTDKSGTAIKIPMTLSYSYDFSDNSRLYLNKTNKSGAISWRFELYNLKNENQYLSESGVSRYENQSTNINNKQTDIKILQILADDASDKANLQSALDDSGSLFGKYAKGLTDFNITATTIKLSEFVTQANDKTSTTSTLNQEDYNCYVVSCGSELTSNSEKTYQNAADYLVAKANAGITVVFTGEALNDGTQSSDMKDVLNMSRFVDKKDYYGTIQDSASRPYGKSDEGYAAAKCEYTYAKVMKEGSGSNKVYNNTIWKKLSYGDSPAKENSVNRNNKGRVTTYPYTISQGIDDVASVKAQDYQLNMNNEGLVVWYSLGQLGEADATEYGISPRDGANNYYLYSVENVVYDLIDLENVSSDMEMKLFINTLSGTASSPNVVIDAGKTVDSGYNDFAISDATSDYFKDSLAADGTKKTSDGQDMTVFEGSIKPAGSKYQDYEPDAVEITPAPEEDGNGNDSEDPNASAEPTSTPSEAPSEPTPVPTKEPTIFDVPSPIGWSAYEFNDEKDFEGWDDDAVLVIDYAVDYPGDWNVFTLQKNDKQYSWIHPDIKEFKAKTQVVYITLGELKQLEGLGADEKLTYIRFQGSSNTTINTVGIFESEKHYEDFKKNGGNSGSSGGSSEPGEKIEVKESDKDLMPTHDTEKIDFIPKNATHRIYFTPYTNSVDCANVNSFKISNVTASLNQLGTENESLVERGAKYVDTIYQDVIDEQGNEHVWKYTASKDHTFTIKANNFLKDKSQYYFYSNGSYINRSADTSNDKTRWVRFDISNRRRSAVTYLHLHYSADMDKTYVFPLD